MLSAPVFRISGIQDVMPGPSISAGRGQGAKDLRGISTITGKGNGQGGSHVQRKIPGYRLPSSADPYARPVPG